MKKAKLAAKKVRPFEIIKMMNPNVAKLKLPRNMKRLQSSFNVDLFSLCKQKDFEFAGRPNTKALTFILESDT